MPPNIHLTSALFIATLVTKLVCKTVCQKKQIPKERRTLPFPSFPFPFFQDFVGVCPELYVTNSFHEAPFNRLFVQARGSCVNHTADPVTPSLCAISLCLNLWGTWDEFLPHPSCQVGTKGSAGEARRLSVFLPHQPVLLKFHILMIFNQLIPDPNHLRLNQLKPWLPAPTLLSCASKM